MFDKDFQKELSGKFDILKKKLDEIASGKQDFYKSVNQNRIDLLYKHLESGKKLEELIFKTLTSLESFKSSHEDSAEIFVKINEIQEMTEKMLIQINDEIEVVEELKNSIAENNKVISKNVTLLEERFNKNKK